MNYLKTNLICLNVVNVAHLSDGAQDNITFEISGRNSSCFLHLLLLKCFHIDILSIVVSK